MPSYGVPRHSWIVKACSENPSQTYGNMMLDETTEIKPMSISLTHSSLLHGPVCVRVCVRVYLSMSGLFSPHPRLQWIFCHKYMLCLPTGLWSIVYNCTQQEKEGSSYEPLPDGNQISSSAGTLKCLIKPEVLTGLNYSDTLR